MSASLSVVERDLREQWDLLRAWLDELDDPASTAPSPLPGWSVADLVAHLGRTMDALAACRPFTEDDGGPLTLGAYLATYRAAPPGEIDAITKAVTAQIADDPLDHLDRFAAAGLERLVELGRAGEDAVVVARRGPIGLRDFAVSRLIELVVHADDIAPLLPLPSPVDPTARTIVAEALLEVLRERTGYDLLVADESAWVLAATGRLDWSDAVARGAVRPANASDGTPELSAVLPLL